LTVRLDHFTGVTESPQDPVFKPLFSKKTNPWVLPPYPISGGDSEEATPVPIPNTVVKLLSANGTARAIAWESRSPPDPYITKAGKHSMLPGFCLSSTNTPGFQFRAIRRGLRIVRHFWWRSTEMMVI
jgi:hypothetical protein